MCRASLLPQQPGAPFPPLLWPGTWAPCEANSSGRAAWLLLAGTRSETGTQGREQDAGACPARLQGRCSSALALAEDREQRVKPVLTPALLAVVLGAKYLCVGITAASRAGDQ